MNSRGWEKSSYPFDFDSVMMYGYVHEVMQRRDPNKKNNIGTGYQVHRKLGWQRNRVRLSAYDALQVQYSYCDAATSTPSVVAVKDWVYKETVQCPRLIYNTVRTIFEDRICDGVYDCPGGQDEKGRMGECIKGELTKNNCCKELIGTHQYYDHCVADVS